METNRDYFSWSQYILWKSSKFQFYKRYVLGDKLHLPAFDKGKEFADFRETGEMPHYVDDPLLKSVSSLIPIIGKPEFKIEVGFDFSDVEGDSIKLLSYLDECKEDLTEFFEFKTGKNPWTQESVNNHKQLDFYAACLHILSGYKIIPKCKLYWIETQEVEVRGEKKLMYTGVVEPFTKQFTKIDIENILVDIATSYQEIQTWEYEEIELEDSQVERYLYLLEQSKSINNELNIIKLKVLDELNQVGSKYGVAKKGKFSISERKTPIYSKELVKLKKEYDAEIKSLQKAEKDSPNIKYSITESLLFKEIK